MQNWEAVFFDFDGVILDSVNVKTDAFAQMFRPYGPDIEKAVVRYHLDNGGVSRYEKFRYFYEQLLGKTITEQELSDLGQQFSDLVVKKVIDSPFIAGAWDTLQQIRQNLIPAFVVSGTPDEEIKIIVNEKGLSSYFQEVHGSPRKKWEITADILFQRSLKSDKCIFIGDALSDYEAAQENWMHFLGIVPKNEKSIFPAHTDISSEVTL